MTKEEMIEALKSIKDPKIEKAVIYKLGKELGLKLKPTNCKKCLNDYKNMIAEELGVIENAAEESEFNEPNTEWVYLPNRANTWHGHLINQNTPTDIIEQFVETHPTGYYKRVNKEEQPKEEVAENINNNE